MTSRAQMPLVRRRSHSENLTFSALRCEQMSNEKRASDDETKKTQEHRNIATLSLQLRSYNKYIFALSVTSAMLSAIFTCAGVNI